jgi:hypothetical protein
MLNQKPDTVKAAYKARTQHYLSYLRVPQHIHEMLASSDTVLGVLEFAGTAHRPFWTYVTSGMSEREQSSKAGKSVFTELLFYSALKSPWAVELLRKLASYPFEHKEQLGPGHTISLAGPIRPGSQLTSLLLLEPLLEEQGFSQMTVQGKEIQILWVLPLTEAEQKAVANQGYSAFERRILDTPHNQLMDFRRRSLI